jgi:hypothetical protein
VVVGVGVWVVEGDADEVGAVTRGPAAGGRRRGSRLWARR